jgi:N utilization substance protein B
MTLSRHRAREVALQILYRYEVAKIDEGFVIPEGSELSTDLQKHFEHFQIEPGLRAFAAELVISTLSHLAALDAEIEARSKNWKVGRMSVIDRCLLRMAFGEMRQFPSTDRAVVIDEAIELAKQFGTSDSSSFVNGILDAPSLR